jgi:rubrerythrin
MFDFVGVAEFGRMTGRHERTVRKMIASGILRDTGYSLVPIPPKRGGRRVGRWAIGVPVSGILYTCPHCGHQWREEDSIPAECPSCQSTDIERRQAA